MIVTSASSTVTSKLHVLSLPTASVAVQFTVVVPTGKTLPEAGTQTTVGASSQSSVATTSNFEEPALRHRAFENGVGQAGDHGCLCIGLPTVTSKLHILSFPDASVAVQFTVVVPGKNVLPDAGSHTTTGALSQSSVALTSNSNTTPALSAQARVVSAKHSRTGAKVSAAKVGSVGRKSHASLGFGCDFPAGERVGQRR